MNLIFFPTDDMPNLNTLHKKTNINNKKNKTCYHQYILLMITHKILSNDITLILKSFFDKSILLIKH